MVVFRLFTESTFDVFLNLFDFYIFREIYASHASGNKTDLMQFLQKIEKVLVYKTNTTKQPPFFF